MPTFDGPLTIRNRKDGLVNLYAGDTAIALCLQRTDAEYFIQTIARCQSLQVAAQSLLDHRAKDYLDNTITPYRELKGAIA